MLTTALVFIAIFLRLLAGIGYLRATLSGRVKPSAVSWFFWGVTPMIAFAVQVQQDVGLQALTTLALGIGPLAIFLTVILKNKGTLRFSTADKVSAFFASLGLLLWFLTANPLLALLFSIIGDIFSSIPTIIKSFKDPESEHALPYFLSMLSMGATLLAIREWDVAHYAFTLYILLINVTFVTLIYGQVGPRWRNRAKRHTHPGQSLAISAKRANDYRPL
jgi:hypothetical protein